MLKTIYNELREVQIYKCFGMNVSGLDAMEKRNAFTSALPLLFTNFSSFSEAILQRQHLLYPEILTKHF